jgi:hypothetical protein
MKLPAHRAGLPGKVSSFYTVPLDRAYPGLAGRDTFRSNVQTVLVFLVLNFGHSNLFRVWCFEFLSSPFRGRGNHERVSRKDIDR